MQIFKNKLLVTLLAYLLGIASFFFFTMIYQYPHQKQHHERVGFIDKQCSHNIPVPLGVQAMPIKSTSELSKSNTYFVDLPISLLLSNDLEKQALGVSLLVSQNSVESRSVLKALSFETSRHLLIRLAAIEGMQEQWQYFSDDLLQLTKSEHSQIRSSAFIASINLNESSKFAFAHEALRQLSIEQDVSAAISMVELVRHSSEAYLLYSYLSTPPPFTDTKSLSQWYDYICIEALSSVRPMLSKCKS